jgi:hypothetical protein
MLLPVRTAVLNYLYGVKSADIDKIMENLKPLYGSEGQFTKKRFLDHVMSLEANGMIDMESYELDENQELSLIFRINDEGRKAVKRYIPKKYSQGER